MTTSPDCFLDAVALYVNFFDSILFAVALYDNAVPVGLATLNRDFSSPFASVECWSRLLRETPRHQRGRNQHAAVF